MGRKYCRPFAGLVGVSMLVLALAIPGSAAATPKFGKTYTGTASGTVTEVNGTTGVHTDMDWQMTGLRFKLHKKVGGLIKNGIYKITAGTAVINAVETGQCSYASHSTISFPGALVKPGVTYPLILTYTPLYKTTGWTASFLLKDPVITAESCDAGATTLDRPVPLPDLLNMGYADHKSLSRIKGRYVLSDTHDYGHTTTRTSWKWNLKSK